MSGHSSFIEMTLLADGREFPVVQSGGESLILQSKASIPAGPATLLVVIDGDESRFEQNLLFPVEGTEVKLGVVEEKVEASPV